MRLKCNHASSMVLGSQSLRQTCHAVYKPERKFKKSKRNMNHGARDIWTSQLQQRLLLSLPPLSWD